MCGIVGYIGREEAAPILLDGLKRLDTGDTTPRGWPFLTARS